MSARRLEALFDRFRTDGDAAALAEVFDATAPELLRVARHLAHDAAEAEDLVQATFVAAIEKRAAFDATRELWPWLSGILLKEASLARRARSRALDRTRLDSRAVEDPTEALAAREIADTVAVALARLAPADREVLIPLLLDGRRAVEIARTLGRRPDTIHMRIHRGLARLRRLLPASFALGLLARSGRARGLAVLREQVLQRARTELGVSSAAATASIAAIGVGIMAKKIVLAAAVLALVWCGVAYVVARRGPALERPRDDAIVASPATSRTQAPEESTYAAPSAASERTLALDTAASQPTALELEIVDERRDPVADALVALVDAAGELQSGKTDPQGSCTFAPRANDGDVYVRAEGRFPFRAKLALAAGRHRIELPAGAEFSGHLALADGGPPPPVALRLTTDSAPAGSVDVPRAVHSALELLEFERPTLEARATTSASGAFRFRGLDASWSGMLRLPRELVFVIDSKPSRSSEQIFASTAIGLAQVVAYRPRVVGRLVDLASGAPIADAQFDIWISWATGSDTVMSGGRSNSAGRFLVPLDDATDVVRFRATRVMTSDGRLASVATAVDWDSPREVYDAGDVACSFLPARRIEFRAVDSAGNALTGARADIPDFAQAVTADENGVGAFAAVPREATEMRVVAPGYAIAAVPLSAETLSPLEVVLAPTNRLTVVLPREAIGLTDLRLAFVSRERLFGDASRMYDTNLRGTTVGRCLHASGSNGTKEGSVVFSFSFDGRVEVENVRPEIPFRLRVYGTITSLANTEANALAEVAIDSLGPTEQRRVDVELDTERAGSIRIRSGRVTDEAGRPLMGALVGSPCVNCGKPNLLTGIDGRFALPVASGNALEIEVAKRGFVPLRLHDWNATSNQPLEAVLVRGRDLRLELVDARGHPIEGAEVTASVRGFGRVRSIGRAPAGVFTLGDLPPGTVDLTIRVAGKEYTRACDTGARVAPIILPEHGRLEAQWSFPGTGDPSRSYQLTLRALDDEGATQVEWLPWPDRIQHHVFESVLPGEYELRLDVGTQTADDSEIAYGALLAPVQIEIVGGATRTVALR